MNIVEQVYTGRDNVITLTLSENGVPVSDHRQYTRVVLKVGIEGLFSSGGLATFDSQTSPELFDLTNAEHIILKLGQAALPKGRHWCDLILYTASAPNGIVWEPKMEVNFQ